jgi:hypothetical protein
MISIEDIGLLSSDRKQTGWQTSHPTFGRRFDT